MGMVCVMPGAKVTQKDLARILRLRGQIHDDLERLRQYARDALSQIEAGAKIEAGAIPASLCTDWAGGSRRTRLMVGNLPADEV